MKMEKTDIGVVTFMYAVCAFFLVMTLALPKKAQVYPLAIITLLAVLNTIYMVQMIVNARKHGVSSGLENFEGFLPGQFLPVLAMVVAYLILMYLAGFYLSSLVFMVVCTLFLKVKKPQIAVSTVVILLLVYFTFTRFLGVHLPQGMLFG